MHRFLVLALVSLWFSVSPLSAEEFAVSINPARVAGYQSDWFHGVNANGIVYDVYSTSTGSERALAAAGFKGIRFPGGHQSDYYDWACPYWVDQKIDRTLSARQRLDSDECPGHIDEQIEGGFDGKLWNFYREVGVAGPQPDYEEMIRPFLLCVNNSDDDGVCSHVNTGRISTSDVWGWMTGSNGSFNSTPPRGVAPQDYDHVAGPPYRNMSGFGGTRVMVQTNMWGFRPPDIGRGPLTPNHGGDHAGQWAAANHHAGIDAWYEVSNEPDAYVLEEAARQGGCQGIEGPCTDHPNEYLKGETYLHEYNRRFLEHAEKIHANDPDAKVFGPSSVPSSAHRMTLGWHALETFVEHNRQERRDRQADGISIHYYPSGDVPNQASDPLVPWVWMRGLGSHHVPWTLGEVRSITSAYVREMPIAVTEWHVGQIDNSPSTRSQNRSTGVALASLDVVASFAREGIEAHHFYQLHDAGPFRYGPGAFWPSGNTGYGMLTGFSDQFTEVAVTAAEPDTPTATYYAMSLWQHMGPVILDTTGPRFSLDRSAAPGEDKVSVYASTYGDRSAIQVLIINKTENSQSVRLDFTDYALSADQPNHWTVRPAVQHNEISILTDDGSVYYNGKLNPPYDAGLPAPNGHHSGTTVTQLDTTSAYVTTVPFSAQVIELRGAPSSSNGGGSGGNPDDPTLGDP